MSRRVLLPSLSWLAGFVLFAAGWTAPAHAADPAPDPAALRARAAELFAQRERASRAPGVSFDRLRGDLIEIAGQLEAAKLDSLAADARYGAGNVLTRLGRRPEAEAQLGLSVRDALRAGDPRRQLRARITLADVRVASDPDVALQTLDAAMPAARALGDGRLLGDVFASQAHAYSELGRWDEALMASRRAAGHYAAAGDLHDQLLSMSQCSQALRFLRRHPEARAITDSAIALARAHDEGLPLSRALTESASLYRTTHRYPEALAAISEAIAIDQQRGDLLHWRNSRISRARLYSSMGRPGDAAADLDTIFASPDVQRSLTLLVRVAGLRARALIAVQRAAEADSMLAGVAARYEKFREGLSAEEDKAGVGEHAAEMYQAWARVKLALARPEEAWQVCERSRGVSLESRLGAAPVPDLARLQKRLAETRAALIEYDNVDPDVGNLFVVTGERVFGAPMKTPMLLGDLNAALDAVSATTAGPPADTAFTRLSVALLTDASPAIPPGVEHLFVVPPTRLEALPFEALPLPGEAGASLGSRYSVSYVNSAGALMALDARKAPPRRLLVLADPAVEESQPAIAALDPGLRGVVLQPLPGARAEAAQLSREPGAKVLTGKDATLDRMMSNLPAAVVHIATHAFDDPRSASRGGLVLSGRVPMLTPARLESLTVSADLVTLSGCGTLGATSYAGEGTFGLARSFLASGARSVVSTRWNVSDRGAARFMEVFYGGLKSGAHRDVALTRARERLRQEGYPPRDCWAFMVSGVGDRPVGLWARGSSSPVGK
jgi:tetratricopeptide (TPR) repeat protein